jgi:hypothetical protein
MNKSDKNLEVRFQYFSLKFTPLKANDNYTSSDIMKNVITYISQKLLKDNQGHLIDRHEGRESSRREMYMNRAIFIHGERRIRCSMALLRSGRKPLLKPRDKFKLVAINELGIDSIVEETHFFIDFSKSSPFICCEYQHFGPRITDIEFYFRNVAHYVLKQSKATETNFFIDAPIDETLLKLKNVLNFEVKIEPGKLEQLDTGLKNKYYTGLNTISSILKPKFVKIDASFHTYDKGVVSGELDKPINKMIRDTLIAFRGRSFNMDAFENFVVKYEDKEGNEEIFNLFRGKKEIVLNLDISTIKNKDLYPIIKPEFDEFIATK